MMSSLAPAKVNLFLHVAPPRGDGFHPIESLAAFADYGDELSFSPGGNDFSIRVGGSFREAAGNPEHNLVLKAARALKRRKPGAAGGEFLLTKNLPAGAGIGGGSSDAAAALRLIAQASGIDLGDPAIRAAAQETGADVMVCLEGKARLVTGIGDVLSEPLAIPSLPAVLVWPNSPALTPAVYRAFDEAEVNRSTDFGVRVTDIPTEREAFLAFLMRQNNDLTRAAWRVTMHVAEADAALRAVDRARLVRMSGSGSTVFAIYDTIEIAQAEAEAVRAKYPDWWIRAVTLR